MRGLALSVGLDLVTQNGASKLWTPDLVSSAPVTAWWDASTGVSQSGGVVTSWTDKVASIALAQATGAAKPAFSATAINGALPGVTGDGVDDVLVLSSVPAALPTGASPGWIFLLVDQLVTAGTAGTLRAFAYGNPVANSSREMRRAVVAAANRSQVADTTASSTGDSVDYSGIHAFLGRFSGTTIDNRLDGVDSVQATGAATNTATTRTSMFASNNATAASFSNIAIGHVLVGAGTIQLADIQKLEGWALWACGKQANLPPGHPYANAPPTA